MANLEKISSLFIKDPEGNLIERYSIRDEDSSNKSESNENKINDLNDTIGTVNSMIEDINGEPVFDNDEEGDLT